MMGEFFINIYIDQVKDQVREAESAFSFILTNQENHDILFSSIHHFIIHVSNVVKLLQPNFKDDNDFRKYRALSIAEKYINIPKIDQKDVHIRNDFEHFDERIDYWIINSKRHNYADKNTGSINAIQGLDPNDNFRWFDNKNMVLYFCGQSYDLNKLYQYIQDVKKSL